MIEMEIEMKYHVTMVVKDLKTGELIEEHEFDWPETIYQMYKKQTSVAQGLFKRAMHIK